ncbi:MAG TPA: hypothetical protein VGG87_08050 [Solirubrobacteraceae bacterium]
MPPSGDDPEISILDARLAEIDRRLHSIQTGLVEVPASSTLPPPIAVPGDHPLPSAPPASASPGSGPPALGPSGSGPSAALGPGEAQAAAEMLSRLCELVAAQEGMLSSMRQLLATAQQRADAARSPQALGVRAGPFTSTAALRSFQAALEALPGVRAVELREFEGADRAILDVHL